MVDGQEGTSGSLTLHEAASVFEGLLSEEENGESTETQNEDDDQPEQVESEEGSEESDEPEEVEGDEDEDAEEVEDEPSPKPRTIKIKNADGSDGEVDEVEAGKGYMRTADYTRKTQAHAEVVKKFNNEELPAVRAERQKLVERLTKVEETYKALLPSEPDWDRLRAEQPEEFANTWAAWQQYQSRLESISKEKAEAQQKIDEDNMRQISDFVKAERERLIEAVPSWKDETIAKKEKADMVEFALKSGFTEEQLKPLVDHKVLVLLRKAMLFDRAQSAKPAVQQKINRVKTATPGPARKAAKASESTRALQRLAKTGKREDVQAAFEKMLDEDDFR